MKVHSEYECEGCGLRYKTKAEALKCEAIPIRKIGLTPGDKLTIGAHYHWWNPDEPYRSWFHPDPGQEIGAEPTRQPMGRPIVVVLDVVRYRDVDRSSLGGPYCHREVAIVYSPGWANGSHGELYAWLSDPRDPEAVVGRATGDELETYRLRAKALDRKPSML